jgi:hypothetical protein
MVNFPSGYALHLTTQEMVTEASYIGKISTDKKYSMRISNSVAWRPCKSADHILLCEPPLFKNHSSAKGDFKNFKCWRTFVWA